MIQGLYKHYKGGIYQVITVAKHTETMEDMVIYRSMHDLKIWARPKDMFESRVIVNKKEENRFGFIGVLNEF